MTECAPNKCKLKVNLKGESQDVSFEQPVDSVEFCDGRGGCSRPLSNKRFYQGIVLGSVLCAVIIIGWFELTNHTVCYMDEHRVMSAESAMRLQDQGITWDVELRRWVESDTPSVTKLSPKPPKPDK